jgi:hypothetical protein
MTSISGWWLSHPSEKYESQLGALFPIYGFKKKNKQTTNQYRYSTSKKKRFGWR